MLGYHKVIYQYAQLVQCMLFISVLLINFCCSVAMPKRNGASSPAYSVGF